MKLIAVLIIPLCLILLNCGERRAAARAPNVPVNYTSYKDIPGVTADEISAIEALRKQGKTYIYGMVPSTEAFLGTDGEIHGFAALTCELLTELFGMTFKVAHYEWDELVAGLGQKENAECGMRNAERKSKPSANNGVDVDVSFRVPHSAFRIDFTGELTITDERKKTHFMSDPIALRLVKVFHLAGSETVEKIAAQRLPRYAFLTGAVTADEVRAASVNQYETVFVDNYEAAYRALKDGSADVFFEESTAEYALGVYDDVVSEFFYLFPQLFSEVSLTTQNPALEPVISVFRKMQRYGGNKRMSELYRQGYQAYKKHKLFSQLTKDELEYIRKMNAECGMRNAELTSTSTPLFVVDFDFRSAFRIPHSALTTVRTPVKFLAEYDNYPTSFYNVRERQWQGIAIDMLREIEALTGLTFEIVNDTTTTWNDLMVMLESGEGSMITELIRTREREGRFIWSEVPMTTDHIALLSRSDFENIAIDEIFSMSVGSVRGILYANMFRRWFPNHAAFTEYYDAYRLFDDLGRGKIDLAMASRNQLLYLTNYRELPDFKVNYQFDYPFGSTFAFYKGDSTLRDITDKALRLIDREAVAGRWLHKSYDYKAKVAQERASLIMWISALVLCKLTVIIALYINHRARKRLEHEVQARTAELRESQSKLETAYRQAEEFSKMKSELFSMVSHEMRTPLTVMSTFAQYAVEQIRSGDVTEETLADLDAISEESGRLAEMAGSTLSLFKSFREREVDNAGARPFSPVAINVLMERLLRLLGPAVKRKKCVIVADIKSDIGTVSGDDGELTQLLWNILQNAIVHSGAKIISVSVEAAGDAVRITIHDDGKGIPPDLLPRVFEHGVSGSPDGTGIGLHVCRQIAARHGGEITIDDGGGKGTRVSITLPRATNRSGKVTQAGQGTPNRRKKG